MRQFLSIVLAQSIELFCICFRLGKTRTMLGADTSTASAGVIPCAIAWLFRLIEEQKVCTNTRFSVRVSAIEVFGADEAFKDLLFGAAHESEFYL